MQDLTQYTPNVVLKAMSYIGTPYVWGGNGYEGIDCSGLIQQSYKAVGIDIPRVAQDQYNQSIKIDADQLKPGDLIFEGTSTNNITHVLMYVGNGQAIESPRSGYTVRTTPLNTRTKIVGYGSYGAGTGGYSAVPVSSVSEFWDKHGFDFNLFDEDTGWGLFNGNNSLGLNIGGTIKTGASYVVKFIVILLIVIVASYFMFKAFS